MAYDIDIHEKGYIKEHVWKFLLFPEHWIDPENTIPIDLTWNDVPFSGDQILNVPNDQKGIYCFVVKPLVSKLFETRYFFYVGKTTRDFRTRFKEYLNDSVGKGKPRPKIYTMLKLWKGYLHFYYAQIPTDDIISTCEEKYLNTLIPQVNTEIPKAKIKHELKNIYQ